MVLAFFLFFCSYKLGSSLLVLDFFSFFFVLKREFPVGPGFSSFFFRSYKGVPYWSWLFFFFFVLIREFPVGPGFFSFFFVLIREFPVGAGFFSFFFRS